MEDDLIIVDGQDGSSIPARIARGMTPALFGVSKQAQRKFWEDLYRPYPQPEHTACLLDRGVAVRRLVRALRHTPGESRADGGRDLHLGTHGEVGADEREAALGGAPDAVRLAGGQLGPAVQPGEFGSGPEACCEERQDAGALRGGGEGALGRDRPLDARRPAGPCADRRLGVQLCADHRGGVDAGRGPGDDAGDDTPDDQAPGAAGGVARGDLRAQFSWESRTMSRRERRSSTTGSRTRCHLMRSNGFISELDAIDKQGTRLFRCVLVPGSVHRETGG